MNHKNLAFIAVISLAVSACGGENSAANKVKPVFVNSCIQQESATRSAEQAGAYCNCVADAVFGNSDISDETKNLMPGMNDKESLLYKQADAPLVRGALMSCYTANFYKKK